MSSSIQQFYAGLVIFITGGTGFVGKLLLLKLLQSCPDIGGIIMLLREKRGQSCQERLFNILSSPEFASLPKDRLSKVKYVEGDMAEAGLGLSTEHRGLLMSSHVSIVFHVAASVSLQDTFLKTMQTNAWPAMEVVGLCQAMPDVKALLYVSTAYSQCPHSEIREQVYPVPLDYQQIFDGRMLDEEMAKKVWKKGKWPNAYTYSKAVAEDIIQKMNGSLPVAIFRPSIVINAWKEPIHGWIDNTYTVTRILRTAYLGYDRVFKCSINKIVDLVPVDMCVNAMIAVAWETATSEHRGQTKVYNFVSGSQNPITWREYWAICGEKIRDNPTYRAQWYYFFLFTNLWPVYLTLWFCLDLFPAVLMQGLQYVTSGPRRAIKEAIYALQYNRLVKCFVEQDWLFHDTNVRSLLEQLTPEDRNIFYFDIKQLIWASYLERCVKGVRQYILKDDLSTLPEARKRYKMLFAWHCTVVVCVLYFWYRVVWHLLIG